MEEKTGEKRVGTDIYVAQHNSTRHVRIFIELDGKLVFYHTVSAEEVSTDEKLRAEIIIAASLACARMAPDKLVGAVAEGGTETPGQIPLLQWLKELILNLHEEDGLSFSEAHVKIKVEDKVIQ